MKYTMDDSKSLPARWEMAPQIWTLRSFTEIYDNGNADRKPHYLAESVESSLGLLLHFFVFSMHSKYQGNYCPGKEHFLVECSLLVGAASSGALKWAYFVRSSQMGSMRWIPVSRAKLDLMRIRQFPLISRGQAARNSMNSLKSIHLQYSGWLILFIGHLRERSTHSLSAAFSFVKWVASKR